MHRNLKNIHLINMKLFIYNLTYLKAPHLIKTSESQLQIKTSEISILNNCFVSKILNNCYKAKTTDMLNKLSFIKLMSFSF